MFYLKETLLEEALIACSCRLAAYDSWQMDEAPWGSRLLDSRLTRPEASKIVLGDRMNASSAGSWT